MPVKNLIAFIAAYCARFSGFYIKSKVAVKIYLSQQTVKIAICSKQLTAAQPPQAFRQTHCKAFTKNSQADQATPKVQVAQEAQIAQVAQAEQQDPAVQTELTLQEYQEFSLDTEAECIINYLRAMLKQFSRHGYCARLILDDSYVFHQTFILAQNTKIPDVIYDFELILADKFNAFMDDVYYDFVIKTAVNNKELAIYAVMKKVLDPFLHIFQEAKLNISSIEILNLANINLLPWRKAALKHNNIRFGLFLVLISIAVLLPLTLYITTIKHELQNTKQRICKLETTLHERQQQHHPNNNGTQEHDIQDKIALMKVLHYTRCDYAAMLHQIAAACNGDIVLERLVKTQQLLQITGKSKSSIAVTQFIAKLEENLPSLQLQDLKIDFKSKRKQDKELINFYIILHTLHT